MTAPDDRALASRVGACIREARAASGLSRNRVARSAGLTSRELSRYEAGKALPCPRDVKALAGACGIGVGEMIGADLLDSLPD